MHCLACIEKTFKVLVRDNLQRLRQCKKKSREIIFRQICAQNFARGVLQRALTWAGLQIKDAVSEI